jgi:Flp pilus assembly pilin Flp
MVSNSLILAIGNDRATATELYSDVTQAVRKAFARRFVIFALQYALLVAITATIATTIAVKIGEGVAARFDTITAALKKLPR